MMAIVSNIWHLWMVLMEVARQVSAELPTVQELCLAIEGQPNKMFFSFELNALQHCYFRGPMNYLLVVCGLDTA